MKLGLPDVRGVEESEARVQLRERGEYITKAIDRGDSEELMAEGIATMRCLLRESRDFVAARSSGFPPWNPRLPLSPALVTYWEPTNSAKMAYMLAVAGKVLARTHPFP